MAEPTIVDSHVHVGRNHARWDATEALLQAAGIDTAVLAADPDSPSLDGERSLPAAFSRPGGPYALWYIGGDPFLGILPGPPDLPRDIQDYAGVEWHCYFSDEFDYGSSDDIAAARAGELLESSNGRAALEALAATLDAGLVVRLTENLPTTLALIDRHPSGVFILPHMGLRNGGSSRVLNALAGNPNVYFDTSVVELNEGMVERVGAGRVLLGSDAPSGNPARAVRQVRELNVPPQQVQAILGENARRVFDPH